MAKTIIGSYSPNNGMYCELRYTAPVSGHLNIICVHRLKATRNDDGGTKTVIEQIGDAIIPGSPYPTTEKFSRADIWCFINGTQVYHQGDYYFGETHLTWSVLRAVAAGETIVVGVRRHNQWADPIKYPGDPTDQHGFYLAATFDNDS